MADNKRNFSTRALWADHLPPVGGDDIAVPVHHSVTFEYHDMDEWFDVALKRKPGHIYSRNTNPTVRSLEATMSALEGSEDTVSFSTGMAAISNALHTLLEPGDRVVTIRDTYGGTSKIFLEFLPRMKIDCCLCDTLDFNTIEDEVRKGCRVLYLETPTNPLLKVMDIERLARVAHEAGALVLVDNTFATMVNQRPLELGADLVLYSATKYLNGHSDAMGGFVCGSKELVERVYHYREINGATLHANSAYLILRGLKTLELRIQRHNENAQRIAEFLDGHERVEKVYYPGLPTHINHDIARRQMDGFGGMLSFSLNGDFEDVKKLVPSLTHAHAAASLGSVTTLIGPPRVTSHVELTAEERSKLGIPESLIRYSAGVENLNDLIEDLERGLASL